MVLLEGTGNIPAIRCPFHAWAYALDGSLRGAPTMDQSVNFDRRDYGLISYDVAIWQGFIFARLEPGGPDFESLVGDLDRLLAPYNLPGQKLAKAKSFTVASGRSRGRSRSSWRRTAAICTTRLSTPYGPRDWKSTPLSSPVRPAWCSPRAERPGRPGASGQPWWPRLDEDLDGP